MKILMNSCIILLLSYLNVYSQISFKKDLDTNAFHNWPSLVLDYQAISDDGKFVAYISKNEFSTVANSRYLLHMQLISGSWKKIIANIDTHIEPVFSMNSRQLIYLTSDNVLHLQELGTDKEKKTASVKEFKILKTDTNEFLIYRLIGFGKELIFQNLNTDRILRLKNVDDYTVTNHNKVLWSMNSKNSGTLNLTDLLTGKDKNIWQGDEIQTLLDIKNGHHVYFLTNNDDRLCEKQVWDFDLKNKSIPQKIFINFPDSPNKLVLNSLEDVIADGRMLLINAKSLGIQPRHDDNSVEIWSYLDKKLKPDEIESYKDDPIFSYVYDISKKQIISLKKTDEEVKFATNNRKFALVANLAGSLDEYYWNKYSRPAFHWLSLETGERLITEGTLISEISNTGRYVISQNEVLSDILCFDSQTRNTVNLTKSLPIPSKDDEFGRPSSKFSRGLSSCTWLESDEALLITDRFDIWQLDPKGLKPPINLTAGLGRKRNIRFRFPNNFFNTFKNIRIGDELIVTAFDQNNKDNGFYKIKIGYERLTKLTMGPYVYHAPSEGCDDRRGMAPLKAKNADIWLVRRSSAKESPNLFFTKDFKQFHKLSDIHPENGYKWFNTKLIKYKTRDGISSQAILYKPDSFDPNKKYPVLFNFYEDKTSQLNYFLEPSYIPKEMGGYWFNIPMMLSKGYLVCLPDIHFKMGKTANSIVDCVEGAAEYLARLPYIDDTKYGIAGGSFGGYGTNCLVAFSNRFAAAVSISGISDLVSSYGVVDALGAEHIENRQGGMDVSLSTDPERYLKNSPVAYAKNVTTPILIVNTLKDRNVNVQQGIEWFISLRREGKRAWMLRYQHEDHGVPYADERDFYIRYTQFFDHYLMGAPAPVWMTRSQEVKDIGVKTGYQYDSEIKTPGSGLIADPLLTKSEKP